MQCLEVIVFNKTYAGLSPLENNDNKDWTTVWSNPTCSRKSFSRLIGHITDGFRDICSSWFFHNGFFTPLQQGYEPLGQREHYPAIAKLLGPKWKFAEKDRTGLDVPLPYRGLRPRTRLPPACPSGARVRPVDGRQLFTATILQSSSKMSALQTGVMSLP